MSKKTSCGGLKIDNVTIKETDGVLSAVQELPTVDAEDVGKVLTVDASGKWVAVLPEP